jgi:hypothetical protein
MKIVVLALVATALTVGHAFAHDRTTAVETASGFSLLPAAKCDEASDVRQCLVAGPKEWTAEERLLVEAAMRRLAGDELVQGLLIGAQENGYLGLRRYTTHTKHHPAQGAVPTFSPGFVLYTAKVIAITDAFFQTDNVTDPISGYRFGDLILIHELVHAFDDRRRSTDLGFAPVAGWIYRNNDWGYGHPVSVSAYNGVYADTVTLYARGRYGEAWTRDRSFATAMAFPLPTIQSLVGPGETFADILAHLILDSRASTYLKPHVVAWFETNVFPMLTEKARRFRAADYLQDDKR